MEWDINNLDCDKMIVHPYSPKLVSFLESNIPTLKHINPKYKSKTFTKACVYRYVLLMYDVNSDITKMHHLGWYGQKYQAAGYAGFTLSNDKKGDPKFNKDVEDMVFGKNDGVNDIMAEFLSWQNNEQWQHLIFLKEAMNAMTVDAAGRKISKYASAGDYMKLRQEFMSVSSDMAHLYEETEEFASRFYYNLEAARLAIKAEDYASAILQGDDFKGDNPHGVNYKAEKPKFLGDDEEVVKRKLS